MNDIAALVAENLDIWTSAVERKSSARRASRKINLYGIERLRSLILDLAVRGRLVQQDPNEEPASELLSRLIEERGTKKGASKRASTQSIGLTDFEEFALPDAWAAVQLDELATIVRGITFPSSEKSKIPEPGRVACLRTSNVQDQIEWDDLLYIRESFVKKGEQYLKPFDLIISMANSRELVGKVAIIGHELPQLTTLGGFIAAIRTNGINPYYLKHFFRCPSTRAKLIGDASQTTNIANISLGKLRPLVVPLPPLAEQKRIVAKVDELMALCDALERESEDALAAHQALVETLLATLTTSADAADLAKNWTRLETHFDTLFTTEPSIDALKQTLLDLAVRGKLVEQKTDDEPAAELLKRIKNWQSAKVAEKQIRLPRKPLGAVDESDYPYLLPSGWAWARLGDFIYIKSGDGLTAAKMIAGEIPVYGGNGVNGYHNAQNVYKPSVVIGRVGYYCGSVHVTPESAWVTDNAFVTHFSHEDIDLAFLVLLLNATNLKENENATAQPVISGSKLYPIVVGLPPLAEQKRIVAKVDELIALCDDLRAGLADAAVGQRDLADAITERAVA